MKQLLTLIIGLFSTLTVSASCGHTGFWVFPNGPTIKQNSIFVVDGYAYSQKVILGLNEKYNIYLKSGDKIIRLLVTNTYVSQRNMTQAILKPETELEVGREYTMYIDSLPKDQSLFRYNTKQNKRESIKYTVIAEVDNDKPIIISKPKENRKSYMHMGCGPAIYVGFEFKVQDSSEIIVKTTLKNLKSGVETTYYVKSSKSYTCVGHDMCAGEFRFDEGDNYEVEFSFMDASGNMTVWTGDRIKFTKPKEGESFFDE